MCDLGLTLGLAMGVASAAGTVMTAQKNAEMVKQQTQLEYAADEREYLVETNAANKEAFQASLEKDRAVSAGIAAGEGARGITPGLQVAEQNRQGALSIANARDRSDAAKANYLLGTKSTQIAAQNKINTLTPNPLTMFTEIATSGFSNYGAFA
jgi:hypothetical protein